MKKSAEFPLPWYIVLLGALLTGVLIYFTLSDPLPEPQDIKSVTGVFDHYAAPGDRRHDDGELCLIDGRTYHIHFDDIDTLWSHPFEEELFASDVKKGQEISLSVLHTDVYDYIVMIKSGDVTYLPLQQALSGMKVGHTLAVILCWLSVAATLLLFSLNVCGYILEKRANVKFNRSRQFR